MSTERFDGDSIGPRLDLATLTIPAHVGDRLAALHDADGRIDTGAEWVEAIRAASERTRGEPPTEDDLCYVDDGDHSVEIADETESFVCVLDPLAVPFLRGEPGTIRSKTPEDGESITIDVENDGVTVDTAAAVLSIGVSRDASGEGASRQEDIYTETCPYIHAFASVEEYERWADGVDAATTSVPVETGVAIARELSRELFESN
ncbi:Alkylmercury lyase [Halomicrobium zhouii]|uniref:Alkylmercury lyase n=1 Tax=Halomicrobium zhouii TaxID=767519 RepID=A0A1I6LIT2_9EURY|nr:organomercurial lyase [Halomicrobium zhouii]SFS03364.1 Alkylmercury lyase [Halomicrobium zhouii]